MQKNEPLYIMSCIFSFIWLISLIQNYSESQQYGLIIYAAVKDHLEPPLLSQTGPCVLIRWPRYIYFPMDECTQPIRSILIIRPRFGAIHLYTEKQDKTQKVWLMFLCPKNILQRFNLPSWYFWKTIIIGNQISSFVEKHATHLKRFSFQIV